MAQHENETRAFRRRQNWICRTVGLFVILISLIGVGTASAQTCGETFVGAVLEGANDSNGSTDLKELAEQARAAVEGHQPSEAQRACEMEAILNAATADENDQVCAANASVSGSSLVALTVLGSLNTPWEMPSSEQTDQQAMRIYAVLECLSGQHTKIAEQPKIRDLMVALENALANRKGGFFDTLKLTQLECTKFDEKLANARLLRSLSKAEFAIKSIVVEIAALITSAATVEDRSYCRTYEDALKEAVTVIETGMATNLAGQSIEGWRWINDLLYAEAAYQVALGNLDKARELGKELEEMAIVLPFKGRYAGGLHEASAEIIRKYNLQREQDGLPNYMDQIFISQPLPGFAVDLNPEVPTIKRKYFPVHDVVMAIEAVATLAGVSPPPNFPCREDCSSVMEWVNQQLGASLMRRDLRVVAGSFLNEKSADQTVFNVCSNVLKEGTACAFSVDRYRQYYRVATGELSDDVAAEIQAHLEKENIDSFVSRPRVLPPLSSLQD